MAGRETADIVFCMDASGSMEPSFDGVRNHVFKLLDELDSDLQRSWDVRFDFLAYQTAYCNCGKVGMSFYTVNQKNFGILKALYHQGDLDANEVGDQFFTTDLELFRKRLGKITCEGDETTAVALDMAADFPFRDASTCHRVVILLTDEALDTGTSVEQSNEKLMELAQKFQERRIALYMITPQCDAYDTLSQIDKCEWTIVDDGNTGLRNVDFAKLMQSIGKSVSVSQTTMGKSIDPKPLYHEDQWEDLDNCVSTDMKE